MPTYYKGNLVLTRNIRLKKFKIYSDRSPSKYSHMDYFVNIADYEFSKNDKYIINRHYALEYNMQKDIDTILSNICRCAIRVDLVEKCIIYEKIQDRNGNYFAKEICTGNIFPIIHNEDFNFSTNITDGNRVIIKVSSNITNRKGFDLIGCYCIENKVADHNEINEYEALLKKESYKKQFANSIQRLFNMNVMNSEIKFKEDFEKQSMETKTMEEIEYLLCILKENNNELYKEYNQKYKKVLFGNSLNITNPTLDSLKNFENSIRLNLVTDSTSIMGYLDNLLNEYLKVNCFDNEQKDIYVSLNDLDNINKLLLKSNKNYNIQTERLILKKIAFAFLLVAKENSDNITAEDLENSYFSEHIKTILIIVKSLISEGIIESDIEINLNNKFDIANILEIIKNIKFNTIENQDNIELIKKMETW